MLTHGFWHDFTVSIMICEEVKKIYRDHPHHLKLYCIASPCQFTVHNKMCEKKFMAAIWCDHKEIILNGTQISWLSVLSGIVKLN